MRLLDIDDKDKHPYMDVMAEYHWDNGLPFVYTNSKGEVVQQWADGSIDVLEDYLLENGIITEKKKSEGYNLYDKRYDQPFEDDGAYAE